MSRPAVSGAVRGADFSLAAAFVGRGGEEMHRGVMGWRGDMGRRGGLPIGCAYRGGWRGTGVGCGVVCGVLKSVGMGGGGLWGREVSGNGVWGSMGF